MCIRDRLKTNLKAHYFISNRYWTSNYELVKEMVSQSEVYVFEEMCIRDRYITFNPMQYIKLRYQTDEVDLFSDEDMDGNVQPISHVSLVSCPR